MTDLETLIVFVLMFLPAVIFWIILISYVTNKVFDAMEHDKQCCDELTGYDKIVEQIKQGVCEESLVDVINRLGEKKEKFDSVKEAVNKLTYEREKIKYVEDKLNDYLNTDKSVYNFQCVFSLEGVSYESKKEAWEKHLDAKRSEYERDFDNL